VTLMARKSLSEIKLVLINLIPIKMAFARKDKVRILRPESYWFNQTGEIVSIDKSANMRYPITVRFDKVDFKAFSGVDGGANTSMFAEVELEPSS